jgi:hypothetical protein
MPVQKNGRTFWRKKSKKTKQTFWRQKKTKQTFWRKKTNILPIKMAEHFGAKKAG